MSFIKDSIRYLIYALLISVITFGVFMFARGIEDEHISGAFGLFPVTLLIIIFFSSVIYEYIKSAGKNR